MNMEFVEDKFSQQSDIKAHLMYMRNLAVNCHSVVEFGVRNGVSTAAWIAAGVDFLDSYDKDIPPNLSDIQHAARDNGVEFLFHHADTSNLLDIPHCDLLFLDTLHTAKQVEEELFHARSVSKYIVLHDTQLYGEMGEDGGDGINVAIAVFLQNHPEWSVKETFDFCNGLTVLERTQVLSARRFDTALSGC